MFSYILSTHIHLLFTVYKVLYYILKTHMTQPYSPFSQGDHSQVEKYTKTKKKAKMQCRILYIDHWHSNSGMRQEINQ